MTFIPGKLFDFIPSMRKRRLQDLEDVRAGRYVSIGGPETLPSETPLVLTAQQRVNRSGAAVIVGFALWCLNSAIITGYVTVVPSAFIAAFIVAVFSANRAVTNRYGERIAAEWTDFNAFWLRAHFAPRLALFGLGLVLFSLVLVIAAGPDPPRHKIVPMFVAVTGLVFVGPWWRAWRGLRFVFWSAIAMTLVVFTIFVVVLVALENLRWLFGEPFEAPLQWLKDWGDG